MAGRCAEALVPFHARVESVKVDGPLPPVVAGRSHACFCRAAEQRAGNPALTIEHQERQPNRFVARLTPSA